MKKPELELDDAVYDAVTKFCADGDELAKSGRYEDAIAEYNKAWKMIPSPQNDWEASTWILAAIADACFLSGFMTSAREALEYAMTCPKAIGNPFLHLRLGQVLYEAGELDKSADELIRAYMGAGRRIFELDDKKYWTFLKSKADIAED